MFLMSLSKAPFWARWANVIVIIDEAGSIAFDIVTEKWVRVNHRINQSIVPCSVETTERVNMIWRSHPTYKKTDNLCRVI
jgi:hypothetical protein